MLITGINSSFAQTPDELIAVRNAYAQAMNDHNFDLMETFLAEGFVYDMVEFPPPFGKDFFRFGMEGYFQDPTWHTDEGYVDAVDNIVVVDHNAVFTGPDGTLVVSPHLDIYEFEGDKIKKVTTYGDALNQAIRDGLVPAPEMSPLVPSQPLPDPEPTGLSPLEANAEHVLRWSDRDNDAMAKMYHTHCRIKAGPMLVTLGRDEIMAVNEMFFEAFPNAELEVVRVIDLGDGWVVTEFVFETTHQNPFMGVPASGYPVSVRGVWLTRYTADGLIIQGSFHYDGLTLLTQMTTAPEYSPAGTWVVSVPTPAGTVRYIHTVSPQVEPGGSFAGVLHQVNRNPTFFDTFPDVHYNSDSVTQNIWKDRDTIVGTNLSYGVKFGEGPVAEIATIILIETEWTLTGPNSNEGTAALAIYLAEQDADDDGFPDEGQEPVLCQRFAFSSKRLTKMPAPCIPEMP
jgi:predicted ester cyclase